MSERWTSGSCGYDGGKVNGVVLTCIQGEGSEGQKIARHAA